MNLIVEFDRQVKNFLEKQYPKAAGMTEKEFLDLVTPLKKYIGRIPSIEIDLETGELPFVIVIKSDLVEAEQMMARVSRKGKQGNTKLYPHIATDFHPIESVDIPKHPVYLLLDIDRGKETINVRPEDALKEIIRQHRSPLTIDEGVAVMTQFPEFLMKNNCFSLLASRHPLDQRVPAIWINAAKQPNLGWCWDRNPHTWLGSASCARRIGK